MGKHIRLTFVFLFFSFKISFGQNCNGVDILLTKGANEIKQLVKDSLLMEIAKDSALIIKYESCLLEKMPLLNSMNVDIISNFVNEINNQREMLDLQNGINVTIYNQKILNKFWGYIGDSSEHMRKSIRNFFNTKSNYLNQVFSSNEKLRDGLKILLEKYPQEFSYLWLIKEYNLKDFIPSIKRKIISNSPPSQKTDPGQKWAALIVCYSLGDITMFPLIKDFINNTRNPFQKYVYYNYILCTFKSDNEKKLLLEILNRNDILTDMNEAERTSIVVDNYFTNFILPCIPIQYKDFSTDLLFSKCDDLNKNDSSSSNETELQKYFEFRKKCLFEETVNWFKSQN